MNNHGVTIEEAFSSIEYAFSHPSTTLIEDMIIVGAFILIIGGLVIANKLQGN